MARGGGVVNMDAKGRISIPTRLRDAFMEKSEGKLVVTMDPFKACLWLYTLDEWEIVEAKLASMPTFGEEADTIQAILGVSEDCDMSSSGRILVPKYLREHAGLSKEVQLVNLHKKFELWDSHAWSSHLQAMTVRNRSGKGVTEALKALSI